MDGALHELQHRWNQVLTHHVRIVAQGTDIYTFGDGKGRWLRDL